MAEKRWHRWRWGVIEQHEWCPDCDWLRKWKPGIGFLYIPRTKGCWQDHRPICKT